MCRYTATVLGSGALADALQVLADSCAAASTTAACATVAPQLVLGSSSLAALGLSSSLGEPAPSGTGSNVSATPTPLQSDSQQDTAAVLSAVNAAVEQAKQELSDTSFAVRVAGVFTILIAGIIGCCIPFLFKVSGLHLPCALGCRAGPPMPACTRRCSLVPRPPPPPRTQKAACTEVWMP